jgi:hypothetical protein
VKLFKKPEILELNYGTMKKIMSQEIIHPDEVEVYKTCIK